jgi:hypothetical protein
VWFRVFPWLEHPGDSVFFRGGEQMMRTSTSMFVSVIITVAAITLTRPQAQTQPAPASGPLLTVTAGFSVERVARPPLANRPIAADFDDTDKLATDEHR